MDGTGELLIKIPKPGLERQSLQFLPHMWKLKAKNSIEAPHIAYQRVGGGERDVWISSSKEREE